MSSGMISVTKVRLLGFIEEERDSEGNSHSNKGEGF